MLQINLARYAVSKEISVSVDLLKYIGKTDCTNLGMGILYYFNVKKESHKKYNSTVGYIIK